MSGRPLAAKPDLTSLLRCRWAPTLQLQPQFVLQAASDVAVRALLCLALRSPFRWLLSNCSVLVPA